MSWCRTGVAGLWRLLLVGALLGAPVLLSSRAGQAEEAIRTLSGEGGEAPSYGAALRILHDLVQLGEPAVPSLLEALKAPDAIVRAYAAFALGRLRRPRALGPLLAVLDDPVPEVRAAAAEALGCLGEPRAVERLLARLAGEDEQDQRGAAVALGALRARAAVAALQDRLASSSWEVRWRAAVALGEIGDPAALPALGALANDRDPVTAAAAVWARAAIEGRPMPGALAANLASPDAAVVRGTAWALGVIGTDAAVAALRAGLRGSGDAPAACQLVLLWLGPDASGAAPSAVKALPRPRAVADITDHWLDRYGDLDVTVSEPFVISSRDAAPERGDHVRPRLFRTPSGLLLGFDRAAGEDGADGAAVLLGSTDDGRTWREVQAPLQRVDGALVARDGAMLLCDGHAFERTPGSYAFQMCPSEDGGETFGDLFLATLARPGMPPLRTMPARYVQSYLQGSARASRRCCSGLRGNVVQCQDGALLAVAETRRQGDGRTCCVSYRSGDQGRAWGDESVLAPDGTAAPALVSLPGGKAVATLCDLDSGALLQAWSTDDGRSWLGPVRTGSAGTAPSLCLTGGDVLVCGYTRDGPQLMFALAPEARRWTDRIRPVTAGVGEGRGITSIAELSPGRALLVFDTAGDGVGGGNPAAIMGCEVTVRRLKP